MQTRCSCYRLVSCYRLFAVVTTPPRALLPANLNCLPATFRFRLATCVFHHTSCLPGLLCGRGLKAIRIACLQAHLPASSLVLPTLYCTVTYTHHSPTLALSLTLCTLPTLHLHSPPNWPHTSRVSSGHPQPITHTHIHTHI